MVKVRVKLIHDVSNFFRVGNIAHVSEEILSGIVRHRTKR